MERRKALCDKMMMMKAKTISRPSMARRPKSSPPNPISGGPSSFLPQEHVIELVALAQRGSLATIDAGHCIHATKPGEFVRTVRTFLDA